MGTSISTSNDTIVAMLTITQPSLLLRLLRLLWGSELSVNFHLSDLRDLSAVEIIRPWARMTYDFILLNNSL